MKLVKFQKDWADELDVFGFQIFEDKEWKDFEEHIKAADKFDMMFGTNEGWEEDYGEDPNDVLEYDMDVIDISDETAKLLHTLFKGKGWGHFPDRECFIKNDD